MADGHGSTRLLTDTNGAISDRYSYDAYGVALDFTFGTLTPPRTAMLYSGERFDSDLQQYYLRARYYTPANGRFGMQDQVDGTPSDPLSLHKYAYTQNNPVNMRDPSGNESLAGLTLSMAIASGIGDFYNCAVLYKGYIASKKVMEIGASTESLWEIAGQNSWRTADTATIIVHGVSYKENGWSQNELPFQQNLTVPLLDPMNHGIVNDPLNHDFYEFDWGGFSIGDPYTLIPIKSVHQMALVHLQMAQFLVWMNGYANINIISHSWGTTLAYDLQQTSGIETHNWVTMGSPLKSTTPKPIGNTGLWINLLGIHDVVTGLEMYPPFPDVGGLPLPSHGPGLMADPNVTPGYNKSYDFGFGLSHLWVHGDYWTSPKVASDLRLWLK